MIIINKKGASAFYWSSHISYIYGLIDDNVIRERMIWLQNMMATDGDNLNQIFYISPENLPDEDRLEPEQIKEVQQYEQRMTDDRRHGCFPTKRKDSPWLYFLARGLLKNWYFHKYDHDPNPSVPHGHYMKRTYPKLDPYTGWKYTAHDRRGNRVSKNATAELWNDPKFCKFASESICWYMSEFPNHNWRVENPLRLPGRR